MFTIPEYHSKQIRAAETSAADVNYRRWMPTIEVVVGIAL